MSHPQTVGINRGAVLTDPWGTFISIGLFAFIIIATRVFALAGEVINWDESTYVVRAANAIDGEFPRFQLWNIRPPAFVIGLHVFLRFFETSLLAVRSFGAISIFVAACFTFLVCRRSEGNLAAGLAVSILICGLAMLEIQSTNTEQFVIAFVAIALYILATRPHTPVWAFIVGLLLSVAALARLNVAYMIIILGLFYSLPLVRRGSSIHPGSVFAYGLGGALPLGMVFLAYWISGGADRFFLFVFGILFSYAFDQLPIDMVLIQHLGHSIYFIITMPMIYGPLAVLFICGAVLQIRHVAQDVVGQKLVRSADARFGLLVVLLGAAMLLSIVTSGVAHTHYLIQMFPFAAIAICFTLSRRRKPAFHAAMVFLCVFATVGAVILYGTASLLVVRDWALVQESYPIRRAATLIAADRMAGDEVYAIQGHLIYWYLGQPPMLAVATHPADIVNVPVMKVLVQSGIVPANEFGRLLDSRPRYIVKLQGPVGYLQGWPEDAVLTTALADHYSLWRTVGVIEIYRRN